MKKILGFIFLYFGFIFLSINSNAFYIYNMNNYIDKSVYNTDINWDFNTLVGFNDETRIFSTDFFSFYNIVCSQIEKGYLRCDIDISQDYSITMSMYADDYNYSIEILFDGDVIYEASYLEHHEEYFVYINDELELYKYNTNTIKKPSYSYETFDCTFRNGITKDTFHLDRIVLPMYTMQIEENDKYDGDVHLIYNYDNYEDIDTILDNISYEDDSNICHLELIENNYILDDDNVIGSYNIKVLAYDDSANISYQTIYIDIVDITKPLITTKNISISYLNKIEDYNEYFTISDYSSYTYQIDDNDYINNYNKPGNYNIIITAKDQYNNISTANLVIHVIDDVSPVVTIPSYIYTTTKNKLTQADILGYCLIYDQIDNKNVNISLDIDEYNDNYNKKGTYKISISVSDKTGNTKQGYFFINIKDSTKPIIEIPSYTIIVPYNYQLSQQEIINALIDVGQIEDNNVELTSDYFIYENMYDDYDLKVELENGRVYNDKIAISYNHDYKDIIIKQKNKNISTPMIVLLSIMSIATIAIAILSIITHKKKR